MASDYPAKPQHWQGRTGKKADPSLRSGRKGSTLGKVLSSCD